MTDIVSQKPAIQWQQSAFNAFKATWTPERTASDNAYLQRIFSFAADSPTFKAALDWAHRQGIQFFVDHKNTTDLGYYVSPCGVVGITLKRAAPRIVVETLTHEIRHAWQNYHDLLPLSEKPHDYKSFAQFVTKVALCEADAEAFAKMAGKEMAGTILKPLKDEFLDWFSDTFYTQAYGDAASKEFARELRLYNGKSLLREVEFNPKNLHSSGTGVDVRDLESVMRLGRDFQGKGNYLADMPAEILHKQVLKPSLADIFWGTANDNQRQFVSTIRKAFLQDKFAPHRRAGKTAKVARTWTMI